MLRLRITCSVMVEPRQREEDTVFVTDRRMGMVARRRSIKANGKTNFDFLDTRRAGFVSRVLSKLLKTEPASWCLDFG